jgi:tyrosine recombinase xerD
LYREIAIKTGLSALLDSFCFYIFVLRKMYRNKNYRNIRTDKKLLSNFATKLGKKNEFHMTKQVRVKETDIIKKFTAYLKLEKGLEDNTVSAYLNDVRKLSDFLSVEKISLRNVSDNSLHQFICTLQDIGIQVRSQARIISGVKSFFHYLELEGYIDKDPSFLLETPQLGRKLPEILSTEEIDTIENSFDLTKPEERRNKAIIEVMYSCGLRVSELVSLKISQIYFQEAYILVEGKGEKQRLVPLSQSAIKEIKSYLTDRDSVPVKRGHEDFLFLNRRGTKLSRIMIFYIIRQQCELCGINKKVSPHTLRHSFATHLLEGGANLRAIQQMLGHESITTTEIYIHLDKSFIRQEILNHHPRNKQLLKQ